MARISDLSYELLVKILSFLSTKEAVSTSVLSKHWKFVWTWLRKLDFHFTTRSKSACLRDFVTKNLPLHRSLIIESLRLCSYYNYGAKIEPQDLNLWVGIAVCRFVGEISIDLFSIEMEPTVPLPSCLYTCSTLVTLKLGGEKTLVDAPGNVRLFSLKTLQLRRVTYSNEDSLRLLLSFCPVLEDLSIELAENDNMRRIVLVVSSLQRLSLKIPNLCSPDRSVIVTPSLKYFKVEDHRESRSSYLIEQMPELEEADIYVPRDPEELLETITFVKRLSLRVIFNSAIETVFRDGIVFNRLENLKLCRCSNDWSTVLVQLLKVSPKLRVLNLIVDNVWLVSGADYEPVRWKGTVPKCLSKSLETFEFSGYIGTQEERHLLSFIFKHACHLKSSAILRG